MDQTDRNEETMWQAVVENDAAYDGEFVYAVKTTGIFCRPSCKSKLPKRDNVEFFGLCEDATDAGYRACKRCTPGESTAPQAALIQEICTYIEDRACTERITLSALSEVFHLSPSHLQRTFKGVMGISPRQYSDNVRMRQFKQLLDDGQPVTDSIYAAGFGSNSRLYERVTTQMGMNPMSYQQGGNGQVIYYTIVDCPMGLLLVASTDRGVCAVRLGDEVEHLVDELLIEFPDAHIQLNTEALQGAVDAIVQHLEGDLPDLTLPLDLRATAFQKRVWDALQRIPYGETRTYGEIAAVIGHPSAARAVGNACAKNPVALVIPCHRVVKGNGEMGNYRWGVSRKEHLLMTEKDVIAY